VIIISSTTINKIFLNERFSIYIFFVVALKFNGVGLVDYLQVIIYSSTLLYGFKI